MRRVKKKQLPLLSPPRQTQWRAEQPPAAGSQIARRRPTAFTRRFGSVRLVSLSLSSSFMRGCVGAVAEKSRNCNHSANSPTRARRHSASFSSLLMLESPTRFWRCIFFVSLLLCQQKVALEWRKKRLTCPVHMFCLRFFFNVSIQ